MGTWAGLETWVGRSEQGLKTESWAWTLSPREWVEKGQTHRTLRLLLGICASHSSAPRLCPQPSRSLCPSAGHPTQSSQSSALGSCRAYR